MSVVPLPPRMTAIAEILVCSSVPTQLLIAGMLRAAGWMPFDGDQLSLPFVVALSVIDTFVLIGLMVAFTLAHGQRVSELWLGDRPIWPGGPEGACCSSQSFS